MRIEEVKKYHDKLSTHPVYQKLNSIENLRIFMQQHVFAVWDFMSLLKSLQQKMTCVELPWRPSAYPAEMVRLVNQIVLGEESDVSESGEAISHFDLYLRAMDEVGASTSQIRDFLGTLNVESLPESVKNFVKSNLDIAQNGNVVEVAASFFFGREKLIPDMFSAIVKVLESEKIEAPTLMYYLKRHIEIDGEEHGPLALKCLDFLCDTEAKKSLAFKTAIDALQMRHLLWDATLRKYI